MQNTEIKSRNKSHLAFLLEKRLVRTEMEQKLTFFIILFPFNIMNVVEFLVY